MNKAQAIRRMNIIKGQIDGLIRMIEQDEDCRKILPQVKATKNALASVSQQMIRGYLQECLNREKQIHEKELIEILAVLSKS